MKWLWFVLIAYAVFFAPGQSGRQDPILQAFLSGKFYEPDPMITMVFSFLGIFPYLWTALYLRRDESDIPAWPFALFSLILGAFSLLPYLFFKGNGKKKRNPAVKIGQALSSGWVIFPLILITLFLFVYGITQGSAIAYQKAFMQSNLVSVMTADFLVLYIYSYWWMRREYRGLEKYCLFPLAGALLAVFISRKTDRL